VWEPATVLEPEPMLAWEPEAEIEVEPEFAMEPVLEWEREVELEVAIVTAPEPEAETETEDEVDDADEPAWGAAPDAWPTPPAPPTPDLIPVLRPSFGPPVTPPSVGPPSTPAWDAVPPALKRGRRRSGGLFGSADRYARRALASDAVRARLSVLR
jgi:hypothetical protein